MYYLLPYIFWLNWTRMATPDPDIDDYLTSRQSAEQPETSEEMVQTCNDERGNKTFSTQDFPRAVDISVNNPPVPHDKNIVKAFYAGNPDPDDIKAKVIINWTPDLMDKLSPEITKLPFSKSQSQDVVDPHNLVLAWGTICFPIESFLVYTQSCEVGLSLKKNVSLLSIAKEKLDYFGIAVFWTENKTHTSPEKESKVDDSAFSNDYLCYEIIYTGYEIPDKSHEKLKDASGHNFTLNKLFYTDTAPEIDCLDTPEAGLFNELPNFLQAKQFRNIISLWGPDIVKDFKFNICSYFKTKYNEEQTKRWDIAVSQVKQIPEGTLQHEFQYSEKPCWVDNLAKISDVASDPPGQQSVYIPPGDVRKEAYRLSTFDNFPRNVAASIVHLAKQGFHYTGYLDRVKCYSCGRTVEKFEPSDGAEDRRYHKSDCAMLIKGGANDNIPIGGFMNTRPRGPRNVDASPSSTNQTASSSSRNTGDSLIAGGSTQILPGGSVHINANGPVQTLNGPLRNAATSSNTPRQWRLANIISSDHRRYLTNLHLNREIDRLATFSRWPITRPNVAPVDVARAGFFYLGDMDRTQCFSCGGVLRNWTREDNAMEEHRTHFATCRFVLGTDNRNVPVPILPETQAQMTANYPCQHPTNPHMRSEQTRFATFDSRWPSVRTRATPEQIAEAGFFYLGERDRVKCWYCNGGLQNWEYDDIPWVEHAKWFPSCQFLLKSKGQHFVYRHLSVSPHLPRPVIGRQAGATIDPIEAGQQRGQDIPPQISRARAPTPPPMIIDPQEQMRLRKQEVDKEIRENFGVRLVIDMGFDEEVVRKVLEERLEYLMSAEDQMDHIRTRIFDNTEQLLNAVQEREAEIKRELAEEREATRLKEIQQSSARLRDVPEPMSVNFPSVSSNYSEIQMTSHETVPSMASQASGVHNVSGFPMDSDEEGDIYGSVPQGATAAAASTTVPTSMSQIPNFGMDIPEDPASLQDMIERKKEEGQCKICFTEAANMVFMPCSHMCCCKNCTEAIKYCPVCRKKIDRAIIVYLE